MNYRDVLVTGKLVISVAVSRETQCRVLGLVHFLVQILINSFPFSRKPVGI